MSPVLNLKAGRYFSDHDISGTGAWGCKSIAIEAKEQAPAVSTGTFSKDVVMVADPSGLIPTVDRWYRCLPWRGGDVTNGRSGGWPQVRPDFE